MKRLVLVCMFCLSVVSMAFKMSPREFGERIDGAGGVKEFSLLNDSTEPIRYKIELVKSDNEGKDMSQWAKLYPKVISIPPKSYRKFKVMVKSPKGTPEGQYNMFLRVTSLPVPSLEGKNAKVALPINIKVQVHGTSGFGEEVLSVVSHEVNEKPDGLEIKVRVKNSKKDVIFPFEATYKVKDEVRRVELGRTSATKEISEFTVKIKDIKKKSELKDFKMSVLDKREALFKL